MAAKACRGVSFAKYNENETLGVSISTAAASAFLTGDLVTLAGIDEKAKTATSIAAKNAATVAPGTDYIVAEDVAKGAKFVVVYRTKATDIYVIAEPGSAS